MYKLMVSRNCGINYFEEVSAETLEELKPLAEQLNKQGWRWTIEDDDGEMHGMCKIHADICTAMTQIIPPDNKD